MDVANVARKIKENLKPADMAQYIDLSVLEPNVSAADVRRVCADAVNYGFASVCVHPYYVKLAARLLEGSKVTPCCAVGFPMGASTPEVKAYEAMGALKNGARGLDMVINICAVKSGDWELVTRDIAGVVDAARGRADVNVVLETGLLDRGEKMKACVMSKLAGAKFVATSSGFLDGGATPEDVRLMRNTLGMETGVRASGGVRSYADAVVMVVAGAGRIGTSTGVEIVRGIKK